MPSKKILYISVGCFGAATFLIALYMWQNKFTIAETGTLGDGFNGLLAPFISFFGAVLVYLSFKEQIKANKIITSQWYFDQILKSLSDVKDNYDKIELSIKKDFRAVDDPYSYKGVSAVTALAKGPIQPYKNIENTITDLHTAVVEFRFVLRQIIDAQIEDKRYLHLRASVFYSKNIEVQARHIIDLLTSLNWNEKFPAFAPDVNNLAALIFQLRSNGFWGITL